MKYSFLFISLFMFSSCEDETSRPAFELETPDTFSQDGYAAYSAALEDFTSNAQLLILQKTSTLVKPESYFEQEFQLSVYADLDPELYGNFETLNQESIVLNENFSTQSPSITLFSNDHKNYIFLDKEDNEAWILFDDYFPMHNHFFLEINTLTVSSSGTQAFMGGIQHWAEMVDSKLSSKSYGFLIYLKKVGDQWQKIKTVTMPVE